MIAVQRFVLALISFPSIALAAAEPSIATPSLFGSLVQVVIALVLVFGAIALSAWLLRRYGPTQMGTSGSSLRVVGGVMVGQRERLVLVEVDDTWLIVGVAPGRVNAVHSMPRPAQTEQQTQAMVQQPKFAEWLKTAWQKRSGT